VLKENMFNLFGNLLFGNRQSEVQQKSPELAEASTQTLNNTSSCNNNNNNNILNDIQTCNQQADENNGNNESLNISDRVLEYDLNNSISHNNSNVDWVIVDRSEADKCADLSSHDDDTNMKTEIGVNTSVYDENDKDEDKMKVDQPEASKMDSSSISQIGNSVILGSFFEKNETEDANDMHRYKIEGLSQEEDAEESDEEDEVVDEVVPIEQKPKEDWLITPLPCLTSITASQRSIVENDPLENLLIEHPSMSVFMSATSRANNSQTDEDDQMMIAQQSNDMEIVREKKSSAAKKKARKQRQQQLKLQQQQEELERKEKENAEQRRAQIESVLAKKPAEKRKESEKLQSIQAALESPNLRKKGRKNRKLQSSSNSASSSSSLSSASSSTVPVSGISLANKENFQVKSLLMNVEFKKSFQNGRLEMMKRNNKLASSNFASTFATITRYNNVNMRQRKYHKLQQPSLISANN